MKKRNFVARVLFAVYAISLLMILNSCSFVDGKVPQNKAESNAVKFIDYMYAGNAQKATDLIFDDVLAAAIATGGYETESVFVYAFEKELDDLIEGYQEEYGKKWKYEINIIDSYEKNAPEGYTDYEVMEVALEIKHEGRKFFFFKIDGTEELKIQMIKKDNTWYVLSWSNVYI